MKKVILCAFLLLLSCQTEENQINKYILIKKSELPYQVTGVMEISIEEGTVGEDEISAINFGFIDTGNGKVGIDLTDDVIRDIGLSRDDLHKKLNVEATLIESEYSDDSSELQSYLIESLKVISEKL